MREPTVSDQQNGTVAAAVEQTTGTVAVLNAQAAEFAKVLPAHIGPDKFTRWALTCLRDPNVAKVMHTPEGQLSVMSALMDCASLGLEPGRTYHLVPYGGKVTGITDYLGEIELIHRADQRRSVVVCLVRERDKFSARGANVPPFHEPEDGDWFGDRGAAVGGYAFTARQDDCSMVVLMSERDFAKRRGVAKTQAVWDAWPDEMRLKTLVHQLRKFVPWSTEWRVS